MTQYLHNAQNKVWTSLDWPGLIKIKSKFLYYFSLFLKINTARIKNPKE